MCVHTVNPSRFLCDPLRWYESMKQQCRIQDRKAKPKMPGTPDCSPPWQ